MKTYEDIGKLIGEAAALDAELARRIEEIRVRLAEPDTPEMIVEHYSATVDALDYIGAHLEPKLRELRGVLARHAHDHHRRTWEELATAAGVTRTATQQHANQ